MDKLKEYLLEHKSELDVDPAPGEVWGNIAAGLPVASRPVIRYLVAACVIVLAGIGVWLVVRERRALVDTVKNNGGTAVKKEEKRPDTAIARNIAPAVPGPAVHKGGPSVAAGRSGRSGLSRRSVRSGPADEIDAIDKSYTTLIDYQLKKLRVTPLYAENGSYFSFYTDQFKQMDLDEKQVRNDIKRYGLTSEFLEQLINVYQQKLNLLKNLQTEINKMNNKVIGKQSPSAKAEVYYLNI